MIIPKNDLDKLHFYKEVMDQCLVSLQDRKDTYNVWKEYYMNGSPPGGELSPWNKIFPHLDLLTSFLYASDSTRFSLDMDGAVLKANSPMIRPFVRRLNQTWSQSNADLEWQKAILWALIYNSMLVKHVRRKGQILPFSVDPGMFGVFREDITSLDRQEGFVHLYAMGKTDLETRLSGRTDREKIMATIAFGDARREEHGVPAAVSRIWMDSVTPNIQGQVNLALDGVNINTPYQPPDLVEMSELWVWDDDTEDYQTVTMANGEIVIWDRPNTFIPRRKGVEPEHPFVQVCPNQMPGYFWGISEVSRLVPLQDYRNNRMRQISTLLEKQCDPAQAWIGNGIPEEKISALNFPGSIISINDPTAKVEKFAPTIPTDIFADIRENDEAFMEMSGLSNVMQGRGESGVRSRGHAAELMRVGSSRAKKRALIIEDALEKSATLFAKAIQMDDEDDMISDIGHKFIAAQMTDQYTVKVDAHSNSPVFSESIKQDAELLFKAKAIDREWLIRMVAPPMMDELIRHLEDKIIPSEAKAAQMQQQEEAQKEKLKAVK